MLKSAIAILLIIVSIVYLPLWVQIVLFALAVILVPYRLWLLVPAVIADVVYAPTPAFTPMNLKTTLFVAALLVVHYFLVTRTRAAQLTHGLAKK